jgi:hypothetical protein
MYRRILIAAAYVAAAGVLCASRSEAKRPALAVSAANEGLNRDRGRIERRLRATALADTTLLGAWTFDSGGGCTAEGWVSVDMTEQVADYMHVDDFAGLGGGNSGLLVPLEGAQSMWCGARPNVLDPELCGYGTLPGYGNRWNQALCTAQCLSVTGDVTIDYLIAYDCEPAAYDFVSLEWDACDGSWSEQLWAVGGTLAGTFQSDAVPSASHGGSVSLRFRFESDPSWSDYDGLWDTDGAFILDSLTVSDGGGVVLATEDFEGEAVGDHATTSGDWQSCPVPGYGDFAGLFPGSGVVQENSECTANMSCLWGFFAGSTANYACGGFPSQLAVPHQNLSGQYIANEIWSPWIPLTGSGERIQLILDVYHDFPLDNLTTWVWHVRSRVGGCATVWKDNQWIDLGGPGWTRTLVEVLASFIDPAATDVQVALGVVDLCPLFCGSIISSGCHGHAPLFDNVVVRRLDTVAPVWSVQQQNLFQDNFALDGTTTGTVRADRAYDINPLATPTVRPGDSCVVSVSYPGDGLATDPYTGMGAAVYAYVGVWPQGQAGKGGAALSGDGSRWPTVDSLVYGGDTWYCLRMDTAFIAPGVPAPDKYCIDLNDNLFTPGDTVCFVFAATSGAPSSATSYWSEFVGETADLSFALDHAMEFTCLGSAATGPGYRVLYVDAADGTGAQPAFDAAFDALGIAPRVDRYDQRAPASSLQNGLATRVADPIYQVARVYDVIVWSSGRVLAALGDGISDKSDDASLLAAFMDDRCTGGIYFTGDDLAAAIAQAAGSGGPALRSYIDFTLDGGDHTALGHDVSPLVAAVPGGCFDRVPDDTLVAYGGCPLLRDFDVITPGAGAALEASYVSGVLTGGAVVAQQQQNPGCAWTGPPQRHGVVLAGFGFETIENDTPSVPSDAVAHMDDVLAWLLDVPTAVADGAPARNALSQNYPNPFNPATTIDFQVRARGPVTLRVYNVAGQVVRTLVDRSSVAPGVVHTVAWDGRNERGQRVASGVYFYRLVASDYARTRKMVFLK